MLTLHHLKLTGENSVLDIEPCTIQKIMECIRCSNKVTTFTRSKLYNDLLCDKCIGRHKSFKTITDHASAIKRKYNISLEYYYELEDKQEKCCKICHSHIDELNINFFAIDHCHKTNDIRGLLCRNCNRGLGFFRDNRAILKNAIHYLNGSNPI